MPNPFLEPFQRIETSDGVYSEAERGLANRNHGAFLENLSLDVTPTGAHYLLTHFDVPMIDESKHSLEFSGAFSNPFSMSLDDIRSLPKTTMAVTLECGGNGRAKIPGRNHSMPWGNEAFGTSIWGGTPLAPLIEKAGPLSGVQDFVFGGTDFGFDGGVPHYFERSLTPDEIAALDVLVVYEMNGQPLLPQHGAPLRIIVPGWYGMASVKWLARIEALKERFDGYQQVRTYRFRQTPDEEGEPVNEMAVKSLMAPPGVPDWVSRKRFMAPGRTRIQGRAWSGAGRRITRVEFCAGGEWQSAQLHGRMGDYAWTGWSFDWDAPEGIHILRCRAWDESGACQPLDPVWNLSGFANNVVQEVEVTVSNKIKEVP